jgi:putative MATE family efflux protein
MITLPNKHSIKEILVLAFPIIGGMLSHNVINLVDIAMIRHEGDVALAAVGFGGFLFFVCMSLLIGLGSGVQTTVARRLGEGKGDILAKPLNTGLVWALLLGMPITLIAWILTPFIFSHFGPSPETAMVGIPYFKWRVLSVTAIGINFAFRGYWNGIHKPLSYFTLLIITHLSNIFLNWCLIFGNLGFPELGVTGAGIASTASLFIGNILFFLGGLAMSRHHGFLSKYPSWANMKALMALSAPTCIQQLIFSGGVFTFMTIIAQMGTTEMAITNVVVNLALIAILPGLGFGMSAMSLVSRSLGGGSAKEAKRWGWDVLMVAATIAIFGGSIAFFFPKQILGIFIQNPETLALAIVPFRIDCVTIWIEVAGLVLQQALNGSGDTKTVMRYTILAQWIYLLPLTYFLGPHLKLGLSVVWLGGVSYQLFLAALVVFRWQSSRWEGIQV